MLRRIDELLISRFYNQYPKQLSRVISPECRSLLDVGCGADSPVRLMTHRVPYMVGVDGFSKSIEQSKAAGIHDEYVCCELSELSKRFSPNSFDCVLASDVIEHLEQVDGIKLLENMEAIAKSLVVVFTPNGFLPQDADDNPYQRHISGWTVEDFRKRGYKVIGIHGWKPLRTSYNRISFRPQKIFERLSFLTFPLTETMPSHAFQILAFKQK